MIDDELALARELVLLDPRRPRETTLRQAASMAYYGLFHALAKMSADTLIGWSTPWDIYVPIYRTLDHAERIRPLPCFGPCQGIRSVGSPST